MMNKKSVILAGLLIVPIVIGFFSGYFVGHRNTTQSFDELTAENSTGFRQASYIQSASRDSISQELNNHRRNAITQSVAMTSPARGSAHDQPTTALSTSPANSVAER